MATKNVIEGSNKVSASQIKDLFRQIEEGGITGDHIQAILERRNPFGNNQKIRPVSLNEKLYKVNIEGKKTLEELVDEGNYSYGDDDIEPYLEIINNTRRKINVKLFSFNKDLLSSKIISKMLIENFEPATIDELLNLGIQYPQLQSRFNIVALGTVKFEKADHQNTFLDDESVPVLKQGTKEIILVESNHYWDSSQNFQFAGFKIVE